MHSKCERNRPVDYAQWSECWYSWHVKARTDTAETDTAETINIVPGDLARGRPLNIKDLKHDFWSAEGRVSALACAFPAHYSVRV